jgi:uncharacterized protein
MSLDPAAIAEVNRRLSSVEVDEGVRILFAVESGSRAWGFPSPDSDYDVRFVYVRPTADYLRLEPMRDVIERPLDGLWDISGWDLKKALLLFRRGNAVVVEWLRSPLVYRQVPAAGDELRSLADRHCAPEDAIRHYFGLLRGAWQRDFADRPTVRLKKYFYVLRSAAALAWVRRHGSSPPMALPDLLEGGVLPTQLGPAVADMLAAKARTNELGEGTRHAELDHYIVDQLEWAKASGAVGARRRSQELEDATDALFRRWAGETRD